MKTPRLKTAGGFGAIWRVWQYARRIGPLKLYRAINSKNACKACAFGTGGQNGGWRNEARSSVEVCNKNIQAHLSDIRAGIPNTVFFEQPISALKQLSGKALEDLGRLTTPLYKSAGDKHYRPISYAHALTKLVEKFQQTAPGKSFFYASGRSSNEAAFSLQLLARLYGTNNINNCSYYCHQASGVALTDTIGTGTATIQYEDLSHSDCIFVFGANPASNHPRFVKSLIQCRRRGGKVIIVNPAKEAGLVRFASPSDWKSMLKGGDKVASHYVQPHLGGDMAFIQGVAKWLLENNGEDVSFIAHNTEGFGDFRSRILATPWSDIYRDSGVDKATIESIAQVYKESQHTVFSWSMGLTHHTHGVETLHTLVALALLRGMVGKPGAGLLPLRGHSNIQGVGSMGVTPQLKAAAESALEEKLATELPKTKGLDTMSCLQAAERGDMDLAFMLGGNLFSATPNSAFAERALNAIPFKCFINSTINQSHLNGVDGEVLILPIRVRDEEGQATTQESMFNYVRLSDGGIQRFPELLSETEIICQLGEALIEKKRFDFSQLKNHRTTREYIASVVPGYKAIEKIDASKIEFTIDGRIKHQPNFTNTQQKGLFFYHRPPEKQTLAANTLMLSTVRSEGQFNSIIFHDDDLYRGQRGRDVVMMNPEDIQALGLKLEQRVNLSSATGVLKNVRVRAFDIRPGNMLTYYPEANVLIPTQVDPHSQTPGFKSLPVQVEKVD